MKVFKNFEQLKNTDGIIFSKDKNELNENDDTITFYHISDESRISYLTSYLFFSGKPIEGNEAYFNYSIPFYFITDSEVKG